MAAPASAMPPSTPIPRIAAPDVATFERDYLRPARPVVLSGAIDHWPAMTRWTPAYFKERFGARRLSAYVLYDGEMVPSPKRGLLQEEILLSSFVDELETQGRKRYRLRAPVEKHLPELMEDVEVPAYCRGRLDLHSNCWIVGGGTSTALHWDPPDNLVAQVHGTKRFVLFPRSQRRLLYPHSALSSTPQFSRVDMRNPDVERLPRFRESRPLEATLAPGELLFVPSRFWHFVESPTTNIAINFWWLDWISYPFVLASRAYKHLLGYEY